MEHCPVFFKSEARQICMITKSTLDTQLNKFILCSIHLLILLPRSCYKIIQSKLWPKCAIVILFCIPQSKETVCNYVLIYSNFVLNNQSITQCDCKFNFISIGLCLTVAK